MERGLTINTNKRNFFREYIEILQPFLKLRKRNADVFAALLYQCHKYENIKDLKSRYKVVFDYDTKVEISEDIKMSITSIRNSLTELRKLGLIKQKDGADYIPEQYLIDPGDAVTLKFNFIIKDVLELEENS